MTIFWKTSAKLINILEQVEKHLVSLNFGEKNTPVILLVAIQVGTISQAAMTIRLCRSWSSDCYVLNRKIME